MERRKALAVAGTVVGTLAAAGAAMIVNFGLLGAQASEVGNLDVKGAAALAPAPTTTTSTTEPPPEVTIVYQDIPVASGGSAGGSSGGSSGYESSGGPAPAAPAPAPAVAAPAPAPTPTYADDGAGDDHGDDHADDQADDVEEPEGPDDDD